MSALPPKADIAATPDSFVDERLPARGAIEAYPLFEPYTERCERQIAQQSGAFEAFEEVDELVAFLQGVIATVQFRFRRRAASTRHERDRLKTAEALGLAGAEQVIE
jgi:hypothetical protein